MTEEEVLKKNLSIYRNEIWSITNSILKLRDQLFETETFKRCGGKDKCIIDNNSEPHEIITNHLF